MRLSTSRFFSSRIARRELLLPRHGGDSTLETLDSIARVGSATRLVSTATTSLDEMSAAMKRKILLQSSLSRPPLSSPFLSNRRRALSSMSAASRHHILARPGVSSDLTDDYEYNIVEPFRYDSYFEDGPILPPRDSPERISFADPYTSLYSHHQRFTLERLASEPWEEPVVRGSDMLHEARHEMGTNRKVYGCTVVDTVDKARIAMAEMKRYPYAYFAVDTEVTDVNLRLHSSVTDGRVTCISIYGGPQFNFGAGSFLWIDALDCEYGTVEVFREFFEDPRYQKVWHNLPFDKGALWNTFRFRVNGLLGDTLLMMRLVDSERQYNGGYGLKNLAHHFGFDLHDVRLRDLVGIVDEALQRTGNAVVLKGAKSEKDTSFKTFVRSVADMQRSIDSRNLFIDYACADAYATLSLYNFLRDKMSMKRWDLRFNGFGVHGLENGIWPFGLRKYRPPDRLKRWVKEDVMPHHTFPDRSVLNNPKPREAWTMFHYYHNIWRPLGDCLADVEWRGMQINAKALQAMDETAAMDIHAWDEEFLAFAVDQGVILADYDEARRYVNCESAEHMSMILFSEFGMMTHTPDVNSAQFRAAMRMDEEHEIEAEFEDYIEKIRKSKKLKEWEKDNKIRAMREAFNKDRLERAKMSEFEDEVAEDEADGLEEERQMLRRLDDVERERRVAEERREAQRRSRLTKVERLADNLRRGEIKRRVEERTAVTNTFPSLPGSAGERAAETDEPAKDPRIAAMKRAVQDGDVRDPSEVWKRQRKALRKARVLEHYRRAIYRELAGDPMRKAGIASPYLSAPTLEEIDKGYESLKYEVDDDNHPEALLALDDVEDREFFGWDPDALREMREWRAAGAPYQRGLAPPVYGPSPADRARMRDTMTEQEEDEMTSPVAAKFSREEVVSGRRRGGKESSHDDNDDGDDAKRKASRHRALNELMKRAMTTERRLRALKARARTPEVENEMREAEKELRSVADSLRGLLGEERTLDSVERDQIRNLYPALILRALQWFQRYERSLRPEALIDWRQEYRRRFPGEPYPDQADPEYDPNFMVAERRSELAYLEKDFRRRVFGLTEDEAEAVERKRAKLEEREEDLAAIFGRAGREGEIGKTEEKEIAAAEEVSADSTPPETTERLEREARERAEVEGEKMRALGRGEVVFREEEGLYDDGLPVGNFTDYEYEYDDQFFYWYYRPGARERLTGGGVDYRAVNLAASGRRESWAGARTRGEDRDDDEGNLLWAFMMRADTSKDYDVKEAVMGAPPDDDADPRKIPSQHALREEVMGEMRVLKRRVPRTRAPLAKKILDDYRITFQAGLVTEGRRRPTLEVKEGTKPKRRAKTGKKEGESVADERAAEEPSANRAVSAATAPPRRFDGATSSRGGKKYADGDVTTFRERSSGGGDLIPVPTPSKTSSSSPSQMATMGEPVGEVVNFVKIAQPPPRSMFRSKPNEERTLAPSSPPPPPPRDVDTIDEVETSDDDNPYKRDPRFWEVEKEEIEEEMDEEQFRLRRAHERMFKDADVAEEVESVIKRGGVEIPVMGFGLEAEYYNADGTPRFDSMVLRELAGRDPYGKSGARNKKKRKKHARGGVDYGEAFADYPTEFGARLSELLDDLVDADDARKMKETFMEQVLELRDIEDRIHGQLMVATETGRLASNKPNMQNIPNDKADRYKVRHAFTAAPGNVLVVADFSQLELRILATLTRSRSMKRAFELGGDFHSRTAVTLFPEVAEALAAGRTAIESGDEELDRKRGIPTIKRTHADARTKSKILNFSIAYGKSANNMEEELELDTKETLKLVGQWFKDRPEVWDWQHAQMRHYEKYGWVNTITGRRRQLAWTGYFNHGAAFRAAVNTPIQGSAADIVIYALVRVSTDPILKSLGWKVVLQVHDEIIYEGPRKTAEEALPRIKFLMSNPFIGKQMPIPFPVDAKICMTWMQGK